MIQFKKFLLVGLLSILLPLSKGYAEKRSGIGLEMLGKPISVVKNNYSCAPKMISGPSKRKIICANSSEKIIVAALKNRIVSALVIKFTEETSIDTVSISHSEGCRKRVVNNARLEINCGEQKTIILQLEIPTSDLRTEFCFLQHCASRTN
mgnify:FL=1